MKIEEYLAKRGRKGDLASVLDVKPPYVSKLLSGEYSWTPDLAARASAWTGGEVSIEEILYPQGIPEGAKMSRTSGGA